MTGEIVKYETSQGEQVELSPKIIREYLVSGNGNVTDQEVMMFLKLCQYQKLNPFLREAYLIKFGNKPATLVTGKETFIKRAAKSKLCDGFSGGVIVQKGGDIIQRTGTLVAPDETLVGGWAKAYRKDWKVPVEVSVNLEEYKRYKSDGEPMANWKKMPATMIRKVAVVQALREALPEEFGGLYSPEEMPVDDASLPEEPVKEKDSEAKPDKKEEVIDVEVEGKTEDTPKEKPMKGTISGTVVTKSKSKAKPKPKKPAVKKNQNKGDNDFDWSKLNLKAKPKWNKTKNGKTQAPPIVRRLFAIANNLKDEGIFEDTEEISETFRAWTNKEHTWDYTYGDIKKVDEQLAELEAETQEPQVPEQEELSEEDARQLEEELGEE